MKFVKKNNNSLWSLERKVVGTLLDIYKRLKSWEGSVSFDVQWAFGWYYKWCIYLLSSFLPRVGSLFSCVLPFPLTLFLHPVLLLNHFFCSCRVTKSMSVRVWPSCWPRCSLNQTLTWRWKTSLSGTAFLAGQSISIVLFWFTRFMKVANGFRRATRWTSVWWQNSLGIKQFCSCKM